MLATQSISNSIISSFSASDNEISEKNMLNKQQRYFQKQPSRGVHRCSLLCNFIEIAFRHACSPVNLQHIFRTPFPKNTFEWLLLYFLKDRIVCWVFSLLWKVLYVFHVVIHQTLLPKII